MATQTHTFRSTFVHGAFALHHTFSANSESFHANEGTTTNLMDYTESGITLNHKQWTWMHEKHGSGLFGFLAYEARSLAVHSKNAEHHYYRLLEDVEFTEGKFAPWFDQPGGKHNI